MNDLCSIELLRSAVARCLPAEEESTLHAHLEHCESCCAQMEQLAGGEAWQQEAAELLSADELDAAVPEPANWSEVDFSVEHLDPSDDANVLGQLGGYDVLAIVGRGGMGVVLKAFDRELKRLVAIKALAPHLAHSSVARKRFAREAQAAAAVVNPHVIAIHHVQPTGRLPFLIMPLLTGESLAQRLKARGPLELTEVLRIGMQAATGLAAAHDQGLVHRDVKPANIFLEKGVERVVITDFGLARAADDVSMTRMGVVAGTPEYMSPEQARGEALDGRSDLFSLGCVLYEMATGVSPFRTDSTMATLRRIVDEQPAAMASLVPELPPWFCHIVERLLSKDPAQRFASASEVSQLLEQCLSHLQQPTSVPLPASLVPHTSGRHSIFNFTRKGLIVMLGTIGMTLLGMVLWQATEAPDISGQWTSDEWGTVVLEAKGDGEYEGTFTGSGKDKPAPSNDPLRGPGAGSGLPGAPGAGPVPAGGFPDGAVPPGAPGFGSVPAGGFPGGAVPPGAPGFGSVPAGGFPGDPGAGSVPPGGPGDVPNGLGVRSKSGPNGPAPMAFDFPGNFGSLRRFSFYQGIDDSEAGRSRDGIHNKTKSGTLHLKWSRLERRFNGTWGRGADRRGTMSLRLVDKEIRGGWTTDEDVQLESGTPLLGDLLWKRSVVSVPDGGTVLLGGPKTANAAANTPRKIIPGEILVEIYGGRGIWKSLESRNRVGKLLLSLKAVKGVTVDTHEDGEGNAFTKAAVHMPTHVGEEDVESKTQEESLRTIKIAIGEALRAHKVPNIRWLVYPGIAPDEDKRGLPSPQAPRFETPLDRQNARSVVEAFVAAALAGDGETVITLAKLNRRDPKRPTERIENNIPYLPDRKHLPMTSVHVNDAENPTDAIAISKQFKWEHPRSERKTDVVAWFTLSMSEAGWIVTNISFEWIESTDGLLKQFLEANPKSISVPPLTKRPASNQFHDLQGVWEYISVEADGVVTEYKTPVSSEVLSITDNLWKMNSLMGSVNRVEIDGRNLTFHGKTSTGSASGVGGDVPSIAYGIYTLDDDSLGFCMTPFVPSSQVGTGADAFGGPVIKHPQSFETKGTQNRAYRLRRSAAKVSAIEKPLDRQNARAVVEAYIASALKRDIEMAASFAKNAPADTKQIESIPRQLNVQRLAIQSVYVNGPTKPVTALATSEAVKLSKPNPDGQRDGFLLLTLTMREGGWFVTDIDFESEETADRELKKFLEANPKSIGSPPLTDNGSSGSGIDWSGYARGPHALRIIERLKPAWSDTKVGIAFGVSHTTDQQKFNPGERVPLAMFVRNTGDATLKVSLTDDFYWNVVELQDARGVSIPVERVELQELNRVYSETLKPGEAFGFLHQGLGLHDGKPRPVPFSLRGHRLEETPPYWKVPVAGTYTLRQTKEITIEGLKDTVTFRSPLTSGTVDFEVIESAPDAEHVSGIAKPLDRKNARAVVEAFVAAAIAGDEMTINTLAPISRSQAGVESYVGELKFLKLAKLRIESVYVNDLAKPTKALATSVEVRLEGKTPRLHEPRGGFLVLTLSMSENGWSVTEIDFEPEKGADRELKKFLEANPKSVSVPPQATSEAVKSTKGTEETKTVVMVVARDLEAIRKLEL